MAAGALVEELTFRGYLIKNLAEGLRCRIIGPRWAAVLAIVVSSLLFGQGHAGNLNATAFSTVNTIIVALLVLSAGYALTGELALPLGFHAAWNFVQVCVLGLSGGASVLGASFIGLSGKGPTLWTGGAYGPEGGLLGTAAFVLGFVAILGWVRRRHGSVRLHPSLAQPPMRPLCGSVT